MTDLKAPFPYFGGKSKVVDEVWNRLGNTHTYVEPFCGSAAMLLGCPYDISYETINDINGLLINFWRSVKNEPEIVAEYADSPPSTIDLRAKHNYVYQRRSKLANNMSEDPDYYNPKIAGFWLYVQSTVISNRVINNKIGYRKVKSQNNGVHSKSSRPIQKSINKISKRIRDIKITCVDWVDCLSNSYTKIRNKNPETSAIFLDPPYTKGEFDSNIYEGKGGVTSEVMNWCKKNEKDDCLRIALCGYTGLGISNILSDWEAFNWKRQGGYASQTEEDDQNRYRECIWFSPSCKSVGQETLI